MIKAWCGDGAIVETTFKWLGSDQDTGVQVPASANSFKC